MTSLPNFLPRAAALFVCIALLGAVALGIWRGEQFGTSFAIGCLWLAFNTVVLGLLIAALSDGRRRSGTLPILLACVKIPAAYLLLLWLLSRDFITSTGIIAALAALPIVMVAAGLSGTGRRR